jgi:hypothetical protein
VRRGMASRAVGIGRPPFAQASLELEGNKAGARPQVRNCEKRGNTHEQKLAGSMIDPGQRNSLLVDAIGRCRKLSRSGRRPTTHNSCRSQRNHRNGSRTPGSRSRGNHRNGSPKPSVARRSCHSPCRRDGRSQGSHRQFLPRQARSADWRRYRAIEKHRLQAAWMRMRSPPAKGPVQRHPKPARRRLW